jgi:hypothetical protein
MLAQKIGLAFQQLGDILHAHMADTEIDGTFEEADGRSA